MFYGKGQNATELLTSKGALHLEPAKRVPSCYTDPEKFGKGQNATELLSRTSLHTHTKQNIFVHQDN